MAMQDRHRFLLTSIRRSGAIRRDELLSYLQATADELCQMEILQMTVCGVYFIRVKNELIGDRT